MRDIEKDSIVATRTTTTNLNGSQKLQISPEEIFSKIDELQQGFQPEPGLLRRLMSPTARDEQAAIAEARVSAICARKDLIDGLRSCIMIYIDAHAADLRVRRSTFVAQTMAVQIDLLEELVERLYAHRFEVCSEHCRRLDQIPGLTAEQLAELKRKAYQRAEDSVDQSAERIRRVLDDIREQVSRIVAEIAA